MRSRNVVAALLFLLGTAGIASAQALSLEFHDGRVKLTAENVPVSRILSEWARLGGTQIVNGERIPGAPVTLQLVDAPERQALEILLRGAAGYMVLARDANSTGASALGKIMVLPTTSPAPAASALARPAPPPPQFREPEPEVEEEEPQPPVAGPGNFPRGRFPNVNAPRGSALIPPDDSEEAPDEDEPPPPALGNPFGIVPGGVRPGTINTPPRNPGEGEQTPR
jgi:hypothetical protein